MTKTKGAVPPGTVFKHTVALRTRWVDEDNQQNCEFR